METENYHDHNSVEIPHKPRVQIHFLMEKAWGTSSPHTQLEEREISSLYAPQIVYTLEAQAQHYMDLSGHKYTKHR